MSLAPTVHGGAEDAKSTAPKAVLELDLPAVLPPTAVHQVKVLDDGIAHIRIKPPKGQPARTIDLTLSPLTASGQPSTVIGFIDRRGVPGPQSASLQNLSVPATGREIELDAGGLARGVDYSGILTGIVGNQQLLQWPVIITRASTVSPFDCPPELQPVYADGSTNIRFRRRLPLGDAKIGLRLSPFLGKDKNLGDVGFEPAVLAGVATSQAALQAELPEAVVTDGVVVPNIRAHGIDDGDIYSGQVVFFVGHTDLGSCPLSLQRAKIALRDLDSDTTSLSQNITLSPFFRRADQGRLSFRLFEKTHAFEVHGITAYLGGPTTSPTGSFDVRRHVAFKIDDGVETDFFRPAAAISNGEGNASHDIPANGPLGVEMHFQDLAAGQYTFSMKFQGINTGNSSPKIDVTLNVRHHVIWPVAAILGALCLSVYLTKGVVNWRARYRIRNRINDLTGERFEEHAGLPSVVFLRAILVQSTALIKETGNLTPPPDSVENYLDRAFRVMAIMRRYSALRGDLDQAPVVESVKHPYRESIERIMHRITSQPLDQKSADDVLEALGKISAFLTPDPSSWYWTDLKTKSKLLRDQSQRVVWSDARGLKSRVMSLQSELAKTAAPYDEGAVPSIDRAYWMLKLLYDRRGDEDDSELLSEYYARSGKDFEKTAQVADDLEWSRLATEVWLQRVRIESPDSSEPSRRLSPFKLELKFDNLNVENSYLVTHVLRYQWKFNFRGNFGEHSKEWAVTVDAPRITQFASYMGELDVDLHITRRGSGRETIVVKGPKTYFIQENEELAFTKGFNNREVLLLLVVVLVSLAIGLPSLYFSKPTFGTVSDYIAILAWAIGVDQTKNMLQLLNPEGSRGGK